MTEREALKLALEALEEISSHYMSLPKKGCMALAAIEEVLAQPEFIKHEVVSAEDWSEWVCPDPKSYLMKCCDCGLVHEAQFKVVRYKSETEREDCEPVDDPNVQTVFRMRRSEQWSPVDTAHRAGGLPMEQAEQAQPVAWMVKAHGVVQRLSVRADVADEYACQWRNSDPDADLYPLYTSPPPRQPLTSSEIRKWWASENGLEDCAMAKLDDFEQVVRAVEGKHGIKGEA